MRVEKWQYKHSNWCILEATAIFQEQVKHSAGLVQYRLPIYFYSLSIYCWIGSVYEIGMNTGVIFERALHPTKYNASDDKKENRNGKNRTASTDPEI